MASDGKNLWVRSIKGTIAGCLTALVLGCSPDTPVASDAGDLDAEQTYSDVDIHHEDVYDAGMPDDSDITQDADSTQDSDLIQDSDITYDSDIVDTVPDCSLTGPDRQWITDQSILGFTSSGAFELNIGIYATDSLAVSSAEDSISRDLDIIVMSGGDAEDINSLAHPADTLLFTRDYLIALYFAAEGYAAKSLPPDLGIEFSLGDYLDTVARERLDGSMEFTHPPGYEHVDAIDVIGIFRAAQIFIFGHDAAHIANNDYDDAICAAYTADDPLDFSDFYLQELEGMTLSSSDEDEADRDTIDFMLYNRVHDEELYSLCMGACEAGIIPNEDGICDEEDCPYLNEFASDPLASLLVLKFIEALEPYLPPEHRLLSHPPAIDRYSAVKEQILSDEFYMSARPSPPGFSETIDEFYE